MERRDYDRNMQYGTVTGTNSNMRIVLMCTICFDILHTLLLIHEGLRVCTSTVAKIENSISFPLSASIFTKVFVVRSFFYVCEIVAFYSRYSIKITLQDWCIVLNCMIWYDGNHARRCTTWSPAARWWCAAAPRPPSWSCICWPAPPHCGHTAWPVAHSMNACIQWYQICKMNMTKKLLQMNVSIIKKSKRAILKPDECRRH